MLSMLFLILSFLFQIYLLSAAQNRSSRLVYSLSVNNLHGKIKGYEFSSKNSVQSLEVVLNSISDLQIDENVKDELNTAFHNLDQDRVCGILAEIKSLNNSGKLFLLQQALQRSFGKAAELIIDSGLDVTHDTDFLNRILDELMFRKLPNCLTLVEKLISKGMDPNLKLRIGQTMLDCACENDQPEIAELLLSKGADPNCRARNLDTPLAKAAQNGKSALASLLIKHGADVNLYGHGGVTPLITAIEQGHADLAKLLLDNGADPEKPSKLSKLTPLETINKKLKDGSISKDSSDWSYVATFLESHQSLVKWDSPTLVSDLITAIELGKTEEAKTKIMELKNPDETDWYGYTPLHVACCHGDISLVKLLVEKGADVGKPDETVYAKCPPIILALMPSLYSKSRENENRLHRPDPEIVNYLIEKGADLNVASEDGWTPLACSVNNLTMLSLLLEKGADVNFKGRNDRSISALEWAISGNLISTVKFLVNKGAALKFSGRNVNALWMACEKLTDSDLIDKDASRAILYLSTKSKYLKFIDSEAIAYSLALNFSPYSRPDMEEMTECFLDTSVEVNAIDVNGTTALMLASLAGHSKIVEKLIAKGAVVSDRNNYGMDAFTFALLSGDIGTVKLLLKNNALAAYGDSGRKKRLYRVLYYDMCGWPLSRSSIYMKVQNLAPFLNKVYFPDNGNPYAMIKLLQELKLLNSNELLALAVVNQEYSLMKKLILEGADVNAKTPDKKTILALAQDRSDFEAVEILKKYGDVRKAKTDAGVIKNSSGASTSNSRSEFNSQNYLDLMGPFKRVEENVSESMKSQSLVLGFRNRLWIFGGKNDGEAVNEVCVLEDVEDKSNWKHVWIPPENLFSPRYGHGGVSFKNELFIIGGEDGKGNVLNDVWNSKYGQKWELILEHAPFSPRYGFGLCEIHGEIFLIGGRDKERVFNDVWRSSDGVKWEQVNQEKPFPELEAFGCVAAFGKIWIIGGKSKDGLTNQIWTSQFGTSWELSAVDPPFSKRYRADLKFMANRLWLTCGAGESEDEGGQIVALGDVWYTADGVEWKKMGNDEVTPRFFHMTGHCFKGLYIFGGENEEHQAHSDVWNLFLGKSRCPIGLDKLEDF
ncbi:MAG: ankyrin repeat domain-containing protein [Candidatus Wallbacteria bacterium]|nr:ankyrin repeat domain-containing protein [Candidatus Wallbacteria bacterium]